MDEDKKQSAVYVGENDEIVEIIDKIKDISGDSVTLVIPDEAAILQDLTNLKILQRKAEQMGKEISISRSDMADMPSGVKMPKGGMDITKRPRRKAAGRSIDGMRPMSDMVRRSETVDLRNLKRGEKPEVQEIPETEPSKEGSKLFPDGYAREKYFSREAFLHENKLREDETEMPLIPEDSPEEKEVASKNDMENDIEKEMYPFVRNIEERKEQEAAGEQDESYWRKLAEKKMAERGEEEEEEKFERVFDEHGRLDPDGMKAFDFSYPENNAKGSKKKSSVLPTISSRFFAVFILLGVLTASLALYFILPKAEIAVALKEEKVSGDFNLILDENIQAADADAGKLPVKTTEIKSEQTQAFVTTSKKHVTEKAKGKIIIYNECSTGPQTLVAGTRFLSQDGKVFKIEEAANVAGFTKPEDEIVPGEELVSAVAEEAGEAYNIVATSFTIPKLQELGSWKYSCLYARSKDAMAGGMDKEVAYVSQSDYDNAKSTLLAQVQKENDEKVASQTSDTEIFLSDVSDTGAVEEKSSIEVGGLGESFSLTVSVKKSVLSMARQDVEGVLGEKILALNTYENAQPVSGSLAYEAGDLIKKDGKLSIDISASESFAFALDQEKVKGEIAGKNKEELNEYFSKMSGIKSVSVNFWPFWVTSVPEAGDKIYLSETSEL
jgi:hypothetical protein